MLSARDKHRRAPHDAATIPSTVSFSRCANITVCSCEINGPCNWSTPGDSRQCGTGWIRDYTVRAARLRPLGDSWKEEEPRWRKVTRFCCKFRLHARISAVGLCQVASLEDSSAVNGDSLIWEKYIRNEERQSRGPVIIWETKLNILSSLNDGITWKQRQQLCVRVTGY